MEAYLVDMGDLINARMVEGLIKDIKLYDLLSNKGKGTPKSTFESSKKFTTAL